MIKSVLCDFMLFSHGDLTERGRNETEEERAKMAKVECYSCNKLGHYAWGCPDKKRKRSRDGRDAKN